VVITAKLRIHSPAGDRHVSHRPASAISPPVSQRNRMGLLASCGLLPFIEVVHRHEATPPLERLTEGGPVLDPSALALMFAKPT